MLLLVLVLVVLLLVLLQGGFRRGGLTPAYGFAHARIDEERYDIITGRAEAAQKRLFCQGVYFNSKERSFVPLAILMVSTAAV